MAKINLVFDTEDSSFTVNINGRDIGNVSNVYIYSYEDEDGEEESHIELALKEVESDGLRVYTRIVASDIQKASEKAKNGEKVISIEEFEASDIDRAIMCGAYKLLGRKPPK